MSNSFHPKSSTLAGVLLLALAFLLQPAPRAFDVAMSSTAIPGGFHYEFSIHNNEAEDVALVSLNVPPADPLIDPSLTTPAGFLGNYDGGLGIVDFLEFTELFAAGTTRTGFSFDSSGAPPTYLTTFSALSIFGTTYTGTIRVIGAVPEPGSNLIMTAVALSALASFRSVLREKSQINFAQ